MQSHFIDFIISHTIVLYISPTVDLFVCTQNALLIGIANDEMAEIDFRYDCGLVLISIEGAVNSEHRIHITYTAIS